jgi:proline iminopeptidase
MTEHMFDNRIYYRTNEWKPDRLTLILVHGVSGSSSAFWPYEKAFENKYNLLNYDIRGHGMSKKYLKYEDYDIKNFVSDFRELLEYLNTPKFILWSSSFGSIIAREYLKQHRQNVLALIFTSTEVYEDGAFMLKIARPFLWLVAKILPFLPFNPKPRGHVDYSKLKNWDWSLERNIADTRNTGFRAQFFTLRHSFLPGQHYQLDKINVPTLIIHGGRDSIVPVENVRAFSKKIQNAEFVVMPGYDHDVHHNAPPEMLKIIESFIERHRASFSQ